VADAADMADDIQAEHLDRGIRATAAIPFDPGVPGECAECGDDSLRLVRGRCAPCRDGRNRRG
jgi:hypothetical protein